MLVHLRQQSNTIFPDQSGRLVPVLVIFKSMIDRQSGHSNVDSRLGRIALWIMPQNRPILQRSCGEQDDVNVMMEFRFGGSKPSAFTTTHSMTVHLGRASREVVSALLIERSILHVRPSPCWRQPDSLVCLWSRGLFSQSGHCLPDNR
jgi:hypothetical protein